MQSMQNKLSETGYKKAKYTHLYVLCKRKPQNHYCIPSKLTILFILYFLFRILKGQCHKLDI
jgi:hypothetical protein